MSGKGDQVPLKPGGFSARSNEGNMNDNIPQEEGAGVWGGGHGGGWLGLSGITENEMVSLSCLGEDAFPLDISLRV